MLDNEWENCLTYLDKDQNYTEEFYEKHFSEHL